MWFGTQQGLFRYDGYGFINYKFEPDDPGSLSENWVHTICEDRQGTLWVGTHGGGLNKFDEDKETFVHYRHDPKDSTSLSNDFISRIVEDCSGTLWIGTEGGGLNKLDRSTNTFIHYRHDPANPGSLSHDFVTVIYEDSPATMGRSTLWIGTNGGGLNAMDREKNVFKQYVHDPANPYSISFKFVSALYEDRAGSLWIGTFHDGLIRLDPAKNTFAHYRFNPRIRHSLSSNRVNSIYEYADPERAGRLALWVGTFGGGLNVLDAEKNTFRHFVHEGESLYGPSSQLITHFYKDRDGNLWIATFDSGVNKINKNRKAFRHYTHEPGNANSLSNRMVWSIYEDDDAVLWVGTYGGLDRIDRRRNIITHYRHDPDNPNSLSDNTVLSICPDPDRQGSGRNILWLGTDAGVEKFDTKAEQFTHYRYDSGQLHTLAGFNLVKSIYFDRSHTMWVGTRYGLYKLDRQTETYTCYPLDQNQAPYWRSISVQFIFEDRSSTLWVGTDSGLLQFDKNREKFVHHQHHREDAAGLSYQSIISIYQDGGGALWIGTWGGGLNRLEIPATIDSTSSSGEMSGNHAASGRAQFSHFTEKDGLANNLTYGILGDDHGNLWVSTNLGLSKFDPSTRTFTNYDSHDGLQSSEFNARAYYKNARGEMFFGGVNGLSIFHPDSIIDNQNIPPIFLTAFKQFDKVVKLEHAISGVQEIDLSYQDDFFAFEFVALDYTNPPENQYAYKMEGFDRDWIYCGARRYASYTNLPPGRYSFLVKGSNSDGVWNEEGVTIKIAIHPPFWKTWWFISLAAASLLAALVLLHKHRVNLKIQHALEIEEARLLENDIVRKQIAHDFHDELGNKLTNISLFSEILRRKLERVAPENVEYLNKISAALQGLAGGIRDFIWILDSKQDTLQDVAIHLRDFAEQAFGGTGVDFNMTVKSGDLAHAKLSMDWRRHLTLLFKEAIHNIHRHAHCRQVTMEFVSNHEHFTITIADDGQGFDPANCSSGNGLRHMRRRTEKLAGEIEIISNTGKGTEIRFRGRYPQNGA